MPGRKIRDESDARECLAAVRVAGGDRVAWAREHRVDARSLNAWRVALERRVSDQLRRDDGRVWVRHGVRRGVRAEIAETSTPTSTA